MSTERGSFAYWELAPHVYATCVTGHMTSAMSDLLIARASPLYAGVHKLHGIHDWLQMSGYDSKCRTELTGWIMLNRSKSALHIGVTLPLVAMGVTVANLALGNLIQVYRSMPALQNALNDALAAPR